MSITITGIKTKGNPASGISVVWNDGQFVIIVTQNGMLTCGAIDVAVMNKFNFAVAISEGTPEHPLVTPDDLLKAKVMRITKKAEKLGIKIGMIGKEALEKLV